MEETGDALVQEYPYHYTSIEFFDPLELTIKSIFSQLCVFQILLKRHILFSYKYYKFRSFGQFSLSFKEIMQEKQFQDIVRIDFNNQDSRTLVRINNPLGKKPDKPHFSHQFCNHI